LLDCFYATRLLRTGGMLVIDDVAFPSIDRVVRFLINYPCYELISKVELEQSKPLKRAVARLLTLVAGEQSWGNVLAPTLHRKIFETVKTEMVALRKISEDSRNWDWHTDAF
jgi:hypothetical protein